MTTQNYHFHVCQVIVKNGLNGVLKQNVNQ
jgi:hypothetical protein